MDTTETKTEQATIPESDARAAVQVPPEVAKQAREGRARRRFWRRRARPQQHVGYSDAIKNIRNGDLILCDGRYAISDLFQLVTGGRFSHAAIAAYWDDDLMLLQAETFGVHAVRLRNAVKRYDGRVEWYSLTEEYRQRIDLARVLESARKYLGVRFGVVEVLRAILHRRFGFPMPRESRMPDAMFCSQYVARCFADGGVPLAGRPPIDTLPADIAASANVEHRAIIHRDQEGH